MSGAGEPPELGVTVPSVFPDRPLTEGIRKAADCGAETVGIFEWESTLPEAVSACEQHDVQLSSILGTGAGSVITDSDTALSNPSASDEAVEDISRSIAAAGDHGVPNVVVTVGPELEAYDRTTQFRAIVDGLREVAPIAETNDVTVVVEPLNTAIDHAGYFLDESADALALVEAVDSPAVSILFDVYHQQITDGNVIATMTNHVDRIGHVHLAGVPGRGDPLGGELDYVTVLAALTEAGYGGPIELEFIPDESPASTVEDAIDTLAPALRR